jgi:hypothetical protein
MVNAGTADPSGVDLPLRRVMPRRMRDFNALRRSAFYSISPRSEHRAGEAGTIREERVQESSILGFAGEALGIMPDEGGGHDASLEPRSWIS